MSPLNFGGVGLHGWLRLSFPHFEVTLPRSATTNLREFFHQRATVVRLKGSSNLVGCNGIEHKNLSVLRPSLRSVTNSGRLVAISR